MTNRTEHPDAPPVGADASTRSPGGDASEAMDHLRRAEARLARRRQTLCGPSETDRSAMRFILERARDGASTSPGDLAAHLGVTSASTTGLVQRLAEAGLVHTIPDPHDRRRKAIAPVDPDLDPDAIDPLPGHIRDLSADLSPQEEKLIAMFLDRVTAAVDSECAGD